MPNMTPPELEAAWRRQQAHDKARRRREEQSKAKELRASIVPDWTKECEVCGQTPIVPMTGMCGPCTFGEAETVGGNW